MSVNGCFILGLDGQTPDVFERAPELAHLRDGDALDDLLARAGDRVIASLAKE